MVSTYYFDIYILTSSHLGSGIPEMKTIISGIDMPQYLSFKTLFTKVLGLTCGQVAGKKLSDLDQKYPINIF